MKHSIKLLSSLTMIIGVSLSTITSVNAYNYNKNPFENTDELKIIYNQIAKKENQLMHVLLMAKLFIHGDTLLQKAEY